MNKYVFEKRAHDESAQIITSDRENTIDGLITPFLNFDALRALYYANTYHRRSIMLKARLLSQIEESNLHEHMPFNMNPKTFLYNFIINLEMHGNGFLEHSGTASNFNLYLLPTTEGRVDKEQRIYQYKDMKKVELDGYHYGYYSPMSRFYGEPDYLGVIANILVNKKIDEYNNTFFQNGAKPELAISFENAQPSDEQIQAFRSFFGTNFKGHTNAHKTLILSTGTPTEGSTSNARIRIDDLSKIEDLSFKDLRNTNRDEIIAAHGVPPRLAGVMTAGSLGGGGELVGQLHAFNELEIKPKIENLEYFFRQIGISLALKSVDVTNFKDDGEVIGELVAQNIVSVQEARDILGWQKRLAQ